MHSADELHAAPGLNQPMTVLLPVRSNVLASFAQKKFDPVRFAAWSTGL